MTDTPEFPITLPADDPMAKEALEREGRAKALEETMSAFISAYTRERMEIRSQTRDWWRKVDARFGVNSGKTTYAAAITRDDGGNEGLDGPAAEA